MQSDDPRSNWLVASAVAQQRTTVKDIARHAGVSPATVSLVLRKSPLVVVLFLSSLVSTVKYSNRWHDNPAKEYVANAQTSIELKPRGFDSYVQQYDRLVNQQDKVIHTAQYSGYLEWKKKGAPVAFNAPATGLPATLESAVRSGNRAAEMAMGQA